MTPQLTNAYTNPVTATATPRQFAANYGCTIVLAWLALQLYTQTGPGLALYAAHWEPRTVAWRSGIHVTARGVLMDVFWLYVLLLAPYFAFLERGRIANSATLLAWLRSLCIGRGRAMSALERQAGLALLLKFVFVPFMLAVTVRQLEALNEGGVGLARYWAGPAGTADAFLDASVPLMRCLLGAIYLLDLLPFAAGYLTETDRQGNRIRSVDATWSGWLSCLVCYPPLGGLVHPFIGTEFPEHVARFAAAPWLHWLLNALVCGLLLAYASCSVSLGWKASNLTSRGVVCSGLYRFLRHPAYTFKNAAWWVFAGAQAVQQAQAGRPWLGGLLCLACFTGIYAVRALTEERHMLATDADYRAYCRLVRWRFLPGVA
jgi:protein-S-isoprenylcysteine O-methyltransferase Ste14